MVSNNLISPMQQPTTSSSANSGGNPQPKIVDERRKKRMQSNRESARRSRMRKQKHLDDLMAHVTLLHSENNQILSRMRATTQQYLTLETENATLRAQMVELNSRLQSLTDMLNYMQELSGLTATDSWNQFSNSDPLMRPWDLPLLNQPIAASADIFQYY